MGEWPFWVGGVAMGLHVVVMAWVTGKTVGVSTSFGAVCGYLPGGAVFKRKPFNENWRLWFFAGLPLGGLASAALAGDLTIKMSPDLFGAAPAVKAAILTAGGFLVGFGSRWAGG